MNIIVVDEQDKQLMELLKVEHVLVIEDNQYAVVQKENSQSFCKIIKEYDNTMRLADIVDDEEFNRVREVFLKGAVQ